MSDGLPAMGAKIVRDPKGRWPYSDLKVFHSDSALQTLNSNGKTWVCSFWWLLLLAIYFHGKTKVPSCYCYFFSVKMIRLSSWWCWDFCLFFNFIKSLLPQMLDTKLQMRKLFISIPSMLAAHRGLNCYKSVNALDQNSFQKCWFLALVIIMINNELHTIFLHFFFLFFELCCVAPQYVL